MALARLRTTENQWQITTTSLAYEDLRTYPIAENQMVRLELVILAEQTDYNHRATFKRVGLFYRVGSNAVEHQGSQWHTLETIKSDRNFDVKFLLDGNNVKIQGRNATNISTVWFGTVDQKSLN